MERPYRFPDGTMRVVRRWHDWRQISPGDADPRTGHFVCLDCRQVVKRFLSAKPCTPKWVPVSWLSEKERAALEEGE